MNKIKAFENTSISRIITTSVFFCVPIVIMALVSESGIEIFDTMLFFLTVSFVVLLNPDLTYEWSWMIYILFLSLVYFLAGTVIGIFIKKWWHIVLFWILISICLFFFGIIAFWGSSGNRYL